MLHIIKNNPDNWGIEKVYTLRILGQINASLRDYTNAKTLLESALAIFKDQISPFHYEVAFCLCSLARIHIILGNFSVAETFYELALTISAFLKLMNKITPMILF